MRGFPLAAVLIVSVFGMFLSCSDDATTSDGEDAYYAIPNPSGKLHGEECQTDDECAFLKCYKSPFVTQSQFGICTKDCTSGSGNMTVCSAENTETTKYSCLRLGSGAEGMENFCVLQCASVDECTGAASGYNACSMTDHIAQKYCHVE